MTTSIYWPGTRIVRSRGNGFDLAARRAQGPGIFATPAEQVKATAYLRGVANGQASRAKQPGPAPDHSHPVMPNLSNRATSQLKKGSASISLSKARASA